MKLMSVKEYVEFRCSGGNCPICCCGGKWKIVIDDKTAEFYNSVEGEFGDKLKKGMVKDSNGRYQFLLDDSGTCVFLNEDGLCSIQKKFGEDKLCDTCKSYPRSFYDVGDITFCYLTNSCPEVNRMIFNKKDSFKILYDNSDKNTVKIDSLSREKMDYALSAFNNGMNILLNRDLKIRDRLFLVLFFVNRFQEIMKTGGNPIEIIAIFSNPKTYSVFLNNVTRPKNDYGSKLHSFMMVFSSIMKDYYSNPIWEKCEKLVKSINTDEGIKDIDKLQDSFKKMESQEMQLEAEQILVYKFFARFMLGFENNDFFEKVAYECVIYAALMGYVALSETQYNEECTREDRILFYSLCSRTDHAKRKEDLEKTIKENGFYEMENLIKVIS